MKFFFPYCLNLPFRIFAPHETIATFLRSFLSTKEMYRTIELTDESYVTSRQRRRTRKFSLGEFCSSSHEVLKRARPCLRDLAHHICSGFCRCSLWLRCHSVLHSLRNLKFLLVDIQRSHNLPERFP